MGEDRSRGCQDQAQAHGEDPCALLPDHRRRRPHQAGRPGDRGDRQVPPQAGALADRGQLRAGTALAVRRCPAHRPVRRILEITGDWQKFKGLPGAEGTLKTAEAKSGKTEAFAAAVAETLKAAEAKTDKAKTRKPAASGDAAKADAKASTAKADARAGQAKADGKARTAGANKTSTERAEVKADAATTDAAQTDAAQADAAQAEAARRRPPRRRPPRRMPSRLVWRPRPGRTPRLGRTPR